MSFRLPRTSLDLQKEAHCQGLVSPEASPQNLEKYLVPGRHPGLSTHLQLPLHLHWPPAGDPPHGGVPAWVLISVSPAVPGSSQSALSCHTAWTPDPEARGPAATQVTQPGHCIVSLHQPGSKSRWGWPSPGSEPKAQGALPMHTFNSPSLDHHYQARERSIPMGSS